MSDHPTTSHGSGPGHDPHGKQVEDSIDYKKLIMVGAGTLTLFALCTVWAARILFHETAQLEEKYGKSKAVEVDRDEIGIVDQVPFVSDHRLEVWRKAHTEQLDGYGWVDRAKGVAHIPIDKAMEKVAAGGGPAGAPK